MKKTTYILIGMAVLPFVVVLGVILYLRSTAVTYDEYWDYLREKHPDWYIEENEDRPSAVVEEVVEVGDDSEDEDDSRKGITINVGASGIDVVLTTSESAHREPTEQYTTDTLIIVSESKNIRVSSTD